MTDANLDPGAGAGGGGDGSQPEKWTYQLPDDLKEHQDLTGFKTIGDLGREFLTIKGKSANSVALLGENATDDERAAFFNRLGRPEKADGYQFEQMEVPERFEPMRDAMLEDETAFRQVSHQLGLTEQQASELYKFYNGRFTQWSERLETMENNYFEGTVNALKEKWGVDYDKNLDVAVRAFKKVGELAGMGEEFLAFMEESKLGNNPLFVRAFHAIGMAIVEDSAADTHKDKGTPPEVERDQIGRPVLQFPSMDK